MVIYLAGAGLSGSISDPMANPMPDELTST